VLMKSNINPHVLVAWGLLGFGAYWLAERTTHSAFLARDFVRGIWYGISLGLEFMGLLLLRKRNRRAAP